MRRDLPPVHAGQGGGQDRPLQPDGHLAQLGVQLGVVDRDGRAPGEVLPEREVPLPEAPAALAGHPGHHAQDPVAHLEGHRHRAVEVQLPDQPALLRVRHGRLDHLLGDLGGEHRLTGAEDLVGAAGRLRVLREPALELPREGDLRGVDVLHGQGPQVAVDPEGDRAPVREPGHGQPGDVAQGPLVVEAAGQLVRGPGQEGQLGGLVRGLREGVRTVDRLRAGVGHDAEELHLGAVEGTASGERHRGDAEDPVPHDQGQADHRPLTVGRGLQVRVAAEDGVAAAEHEGATAQHAVPGRRTGHGVGLPARGRSLTAAAQSHQPQGGLVDRHGQGGDRRARRVRDVLDDDLGDGRDVVGGDQLGRHPGEPGEPFREPLRATAGAAGVLGEQQHAVDAALQVQGGDREVRATGVLGASGDRELALPVGAVEHLGQHLLGGTLLARLEQRLDRVPADQPLRGRVEEVERGPVGVQDASLVVQEHRSRAQAVEQPGVPGVDGRLGRGFAHAPILAVRRRLRP